MSSSCFNLTLDVQFAHDMLAHLSYKKVLRVCDPHSCLPAQLHLEITFSLIISAPVSVAFFLPRDLLLSASGPLDLLACLPL